MAKAIPPKKLKIKKVSIDGFWGDKIVTLNFNDDVNFLIGVNGSGKTTIINLIAACLNADFATLDKSQFTKIRIDFFDFENSVSAKDQTYIEVEKIDKNNSPYSVINFKIKLYNESKPKIYKLNEIEEEGLFRIKYEYLNKINFAPSGQTERDVNLALKDIVSVTWLSIHRASAVRNNEEKSFESSIDKKIKELSSEIVNFFAILDKRYSIETEKFQKNIFLSLIDDQKERNLMKTSDLDSEKESESLKQIFLLFGLKESDFKQKLESHFRSFDNAKNQLEENQSISIDQVTYILSTRRIHSIVQEWGQLSEKKKKINEPKAIFINEINNLFQRKQIFISEKNELLIKTQSGKIFPLIHLSSGEKQLLIILGQALLQENINHIYIADEPELSLHVEWQEKLVSSLKSVNPNSQIIFATHSPDIVGEFANRIIKVEDAIK